MNATQCPTPTSHKRLAEVHRFWHMCVESYQDPEEFRVHLNACIQAARNLTFALQTEKRLIPDFEDWYPGWQSAMKEHAVMRWLNDARIQIVHRGDLETHSRAIARLITDYDDAAHEVAATLGPASAEDVPVAAGTREFAAPPLSALSDILQSVAEMGLSSSVYNEATLSIERRWEDVAFPDHELTEALAQAYGFLNRLIADVHERLGLGHGTMLEVDGELIHAPEILQTDGRLPCMVTSRDQRTVAFQVRDGRIAAGGRMFSMRPSAVRERAARSQAKVEGAGDGNPTDIDTILDLLDTYVGKAQGILRSGEEHGWFVLLFRGTVQVDARILYARDALDKRALAQDLADIVAINGIDGVVEIGEVWQSPATSRPDGSMLRPAEHPDRTEAVTVHIELADGRVANTAIPFTRRRGKKRRVKLLPPLERATMQNNFFEPVRAVWRAQGLRSTPVQPGSVFVRRRKREPGGTEPT